MPTMKLNDDEFDPKELDVEYERNERFERYDGDVPKTGTILIHRITKAWWGQSSDGTSMMTVLAIAEQNTGDKAKFNGLPTWDYLTFKPEAAFRYMPFVENFDIPLKDIKRKLIVSDTDDKIGTPIEAIGDWEVGSDDTLTRIVVKKDSYDGDWTSKVQVDGWLPYEEPEDDEEDDEDERPTRSRSAKSAASSKRGAASTSRRRPEPEPKPEEDDDDDEYDEEVDDYDDEDDEDEDDGEEVEEDTRPARTRAAKPRSAPARAAARPGRAASSRSASGSSSRRDGGRASSGRTASSARSTKTTRGRSKSGADVDDNEPPF